MSFIHLHTHSHYSLLDGLAKIDDLIKEAKNLGMDSLAVTDHGNLYGALEFYKKAKKAGIKPIIGIESYLAPTSRFEKNSSVGKYFHQLMLAETEEGWKNIIKLSTLAHLEGFYYKPRIDKELLKKYNRGIIATSSCLAGEIPQLILSKKYEAAEKAVQEFKEIFGPENFFLELQHHPNIKEQIEVNKIIEELSKKTDTPLIATQDIHYAKKEDSEYHDILLAVQTGNKIGDSDRMSFRMDDFSMISEKEISDTFKHVPEAILNTGKIADRCHVEFKLGVPLLPKFPLPENFSDDFSYLEYLTQNRLKNRFPNPDENTLNRLDYELKVIKQTGYAGYFLIVQDFINWAKDRGIAVGPGRGSAAGSLVAFILNITDIDPLKYDLLFERFLNPERIQMPDIDVDFADTRRDEVLGYVRSKYGEDHVAQIITFGTMAAKAAIRDAGRALGLSYSFCDKIAKFIPFNSNLKDALDSIPELKEMYQNDKDAKKVLDAARHLEGVARHASVHACGTVISPEPLTEYLPLQRSPQDENAIITQFEMHAVEDLGLLKMDFLGLKNLTIIEETIKLIKDFKGLDLNISNLPLDDKKTYELLQLGDTTGVFQFESSGMRRYLRELKPTEFEDLIAMVALYRPGPMELIPDYIERKHGRQPVTYLDQKLEPILKSTYGIGIYQEQMMRIARDLAGFSLGEADTLRKAIGKKIKELLDEMREKLLEGMIKNNIPEKTAKAIWELFPPFARYGFNRSHAACYALIGYRTAFLRAKYPVEFMTSLLNAELSDIDRLSFLTTESKKSGIDILPPNINKSSEKFLPEEENIRFGLLAVKNVGKGIVNAIIEERARNGEFSSFTDFLNRVKHKDLNKKSLESLLKCGAFDSLNIERGLALANIENIIKFLSASRKNNNSSSSSLFGSSSIGSGFLKFEPAPPVSTKEKLTWEKELLGFYVSEHPLEQHAEKLKKYGVKKLKEAAAFKNQRLNIRIAGAISQIKRFITKTGQPMLFVTIVDKEDPLEMLVFHDTISRNPEIWKENNIILAEGRMSWKTDDPKFICNKVMEL
ncbi:MAG: DNA polymerase III subunit alpha [Candidatus Pacebacteria bacterium]|nr:DNA polymerase III subunit alpha [Candidatus Paceibacterota bacterium]